MGKLITPMYTTRIDERFDIAQGSENNDACINVASIFKDHQQYFGNLKAIFHDDDEIIQPWPAISTEWAGTAYGVVSMGSKGGCTYKANITVNIWYYRDEISKGLNNKEVRLNLSIMAKIIMSHRMINGFASQPATVEGSALELRVKGNNLFDAGRLTIIIPVRICQTNDPSRGAITT